MAATRPYFSEPIRVSADELMTELLRHVPEHDLSDILRVACFNAMQRTHDNRHQRYKCQRFFRRLTLRLTTPPDDLAVVVGIKEPTPQMTLPDMEVVEGGTDQNEYEEAFDRMAIQDAVEEEEIPPSSGSSEEDELWAHLDIPAFEDFKDVFDRYPYCTVVRREGYGRLLILGYASGRHRQTNELLRRNLAVNETPFNSIVSILGLLKRHHNGVHQHIKVVKYRPGMVIRSWTNVQGTGDRPDQYRYCICTEGGIELVNQVEYNKALEIGEQIRLAESDPDYVVTP